MRAIKALASQRKACADSSEPSLLDYTLGTVSSACSINKFMGYVNLKIKCRISDLFPYFLSYRKCTPEKS